MTSTLTSKGQLTVPKEVRERLKLKTGDKVQFTINKDGKIELSPIKVRLKDLKGLLPHPKKKVTLKDMEDAIIDSGGKI